MIDEITYSPRMPKQGTSDLTGQRFGMLVVLRRGKTLKSSSMDSRHAGAYRYFWICRCDCGKQAEVVRGNLKCGSVQSCGCLQRKRASEANAKHRGKKLHTLAYNSWLSMRQRCNPNHKDKYPNYAGVVAIDPRWDSFENFLADMGDCPNYHTLDRIKNELGYSPDNCRWATYLQQAENRKSARPLTLNGITMSMKKWAEKTGIQRTTIKMRIDQLKWSIERALTTPVQRHLLARCV
jgi:hypothetical protein